MNPLIDLEVARKYSRWDSAVEEAERRGLVIVTPEDDEVFVDIDNERDLEWFERAVDKIAGATSILWEVRPSPSGRPGRFHAIVVFLYDVELDAYARIAFQAALGSDRMRETLGLVRALGDETVPTLFFETRERAEEIAETRRLRSEMAWADDADYDEPSTPIDHKIWWVSFVGNEPRSATFEGTESEVRANAAVFGIVDTVERLPYPRDPRLGPRSEIPSLCYGGRECLGCSSCPQSRACSE